MGFDMHSIALFTLFSLFATSLCLHQEEWMNGEINKVREEAATIQKLSSSMILKLERLNQYRYPSTYYDTGYNGKTVESSATKYPISCIDYYKMGDRRSGWKTIDPYKNQQHFSVHCDYDGDEIVTELGLESTWTEIYSGPLRCYDDPDLRVPGYTDICAGARTNVPYHLSDYQINAAIDVSGRCTQNVVWSCHSNSLLYLEEQAGNTTLYGRALHSETPTVKQGFCDCDSERSCYMCHCGPEKRDGWLTDDITIADNSRLPIKTIMLGDLANKRELAQITVLPIKCTAPMYY